MEKIFNYNEYQMIIAAYEEIEKQDEVYYGLMDAGSYASFNLYKALEGKYLFKRFTDNWQVTVAIANPLTREWAREQFVEKEKKYYWKSKKLDNAGDGLILYKGADGAVVSAYNVRNQKGSLLTESEIREWGYNPGMFDRTEVMKNEGIRYEHH